ncbi:MAG: C40 family peptidase [Thiotrichales bacterium]
MKFLLVFVLLTLTGCSLSPQREESIPAPLIKQSLLAHLRYWEGTPYAMGGSSKRGIDCSAYTQRVYADVMGIDIPRSTSDQARLGMRVSQAQLQTGDLVFFRTGITTKHVGVYLGDGTFIHASTSDGVKRSSLDNRYWRKHYTGARRP